MGWVNRIGETSENRKRSGKKHNPRGPREVCRLALLAREDVCELACEAVRELAREGGREEAQELAFEPARLPRRELPPLPRGDIPE